MASIDLTAFESQELLKTINKRKANKTSREVINRMKKQVAEKLDYNLHCFFCGELKNKRNLNYCTNPKCEGYVADKDITWETKEEAATLLNLND